MKNFVEKISQKYRRIQEKNAKYRRIQIKKHKKTRNIGDIRNIRGVGGLQTETFQDRGGFMVLEHFNKHFVKNPRKKSHAGKCFGFFSSRHSENQILNEKFNRKMDTFSFFFFQNQGNFFLFSKEQGRPPHSPPC